MSDYEILTGGVLLVVIYYVVVRRLALFIQPLRLRAIKTGDLILDDSQAKDVHISMAAGAMDTLYSPWAIVMYMVLVPYIALKILFSSDQRNRLREQRDSTPRDLKEHLDNLGTMHLYSAMAANPLLTPIWVIEFMVIIGGFMIMGRTIRALDLIFLGVFESKERMSNKVHTHA